MTTWRYVGHEDTPAHIRLGGQTIAKGTTVELPDDYDFSAEYGEDVRVALFVIRVSPPPGPLRPLNQELAMAKETWYQEGVKQENRDAPDALESWHREMVKTKGRRRGMLQDG